MILQPESFSKIKILVVGDVMLDRYWFGDVERVSPEAPVPVVHVRSEEYRLGGAANVARNITSLGLQALLMGIVGNDEAATLVEGLLTESKIDNGLGVDDTVPTTVKLRINGRAQQLLRVDFESSPCQAALERMEASFSNACDGCGAVVLSDYGKGGLGRISNMISQARALALPVFVDPKGADYKAYRGASVITPNRAELTQVIGSWEDENQLAERVFRLRDEFSLGAVLLTRSEEGMSLFDGDGKLDVSAQAKEVFDVTGAGDTVIGTYAALIAAGLGLREALPLANRAGGIVVGKFGTAAITAEELF